jgi:hypothetical protein
VEDLLHTCKVRFGLDRRLEQGALNWPVTGDAQCLPFVDGSFDGVICMNALHHMPSYEQTLRELWRVLKPGAWAVFGEPGEKHASSPLSQQAMREYGFVEKNLPLPLIYTYARRVGFERMVRYPYLHPEVMGYPYPEESASVPAIVRRMVQVLPDWLRGLSLFALEKPGKEPPTSNLSPLQQVQHCLSAELTLLQYREEVPAGSDFVARVRALNTGDVIWLAAPRPYGGYVQLGIRLCNIHGRLLRDDLARGPLPRDVAPGEEVEIEVTVPAPGPGEYLLRYDLVDEGRSWFELLGSEAREHPLKVFDPLTFL